VPGEQQEHPHRGGLEVAHALGRAQPREHVLARLPALARHQLLAVAEQVAQALLRSRPIPHVAGGLRPGPELRPVLIGHPEQLADHPDRQRQRQRLVQIRGRAVLGQLVEQPGGEGLDAGAQCPHALG
jgi:hypothetical protein